MARYTGPVTRKSRRLRVDLVGGDQAFERRPYPPGQHGRGRVKESEYRTQLQEKQKARFAYGVLEKQFRRYYEEADRHPGKTGEKLLQILESRLDNVVYRAGFAATRRQARQLVVHGHFLVNGQRVNIPSYRVKAHDIIDVAEKSLLAVELEDDVLAEAEVLEDELLPPGLVRLRRRRVADRHRYRLGKPVAPCHGGGEREHRGRVPAPGEEHEAGGRGQCLGECGLEGLASRQPGECGWGGCGGGTGQAEQGLRPGQCRECGVRRRCLHKGAVFTHLRAGRP